MVKSIKEALDKIGLGNERFKDKTDDQVRGLIKEKAANAVRLAHPDKQEDKDSRHHTDNFQAIREARAYLQDWLKKQQEQNNKNLAELLAEENRQQQRAGVYNAQDSQASKKPLALEGRLAIEGPKPKNRAQLDRFFNEAKKEGILTGHIWDPVQENKCKLTFPDPSAPCSYEHQGDRGVFTVSSPASVSTLVNVLKLTGKMGGALDLSKSRGLEFAGYDKASAKGVMCLMSEKTGVAISDEKGVMTPEQKSAEVEALKTSLGEKKFSELSAEIDRHLNKQPAIESKSQRASVLAPLSSPRAIEAPKEEAKEAQDNNDEQDKEVGPRSIGPGAVG